MKERLKKNLNSVSSKELQIYAENLGIDINIGTVNKALKTKATLIYELADYIDANNIYNTLYDFSSKGCILFYGYNFIEEKTLFSNEMNTELDEKYHVVSNAGGKIFYPKIPINIFYEMSIFFPTGKNYVILFKKYASNKLSASRSLKKIESDFSIKIQNTCIEPNLNFKISEYFKTNNLIYKRKYNNGNYIVLSYISHQYISKDIKTYSRLHYYKNSEAIEKTVDYATNSLTSESMAIKLSQSGLPAEVEYLLKIPNSTIETIRDVGVNFILGNASMAIRYGIIFDKDSIRINNIDTGIVDLYNVVRLIKEQINGNI